MLSAPSIIISCDLMDETRSRNQSSPFDKTNSSIAGSYDISALSTFFLALSDSVVSGQSIVYTLPSSIVFDTKTQKSIPKALGSEEKNSMNVYPKSILYPFSISMGFNILFLLSFVFSKFLGKFDAMCVSLFLLLVSMLVTWKSAEKALLIREKSTA